MKIFVTVGTTRFDSLARHIFETPWFGEQDCILQVGPGGIMNDRFECFEYTDRIDEYYCEAEVVVSHAGAGSIYRLLSLEKRVVIVPNTDRIDTHQFDIARFMHRHRYARTIDHLRELVPAIIDIARTEPVPFRPDPFFATGQIFDFIDKGRS